MRQLIAIIFFSSTLVSLNGQEYLNGHADESIDSMYVQMEDLFRAKKISAVDSVGSLMLEYWKKQHVLNPGSEASQNYFFFVVQSFKIGFILKRTSKKDFAAYEKYEKLVRATFGKNHKTLAYYLKYLGLGYMNITGDFAKAGEAFQESKEICDVEFGVGSVRSALMLMHVGETYRKRMDLDLALKIHEEARAMMEPEAENYQTEYAQSLGSIGVIYIYKNEYKKALEIFLDLEQRAKKLGKKGNNVRSIASQNIANCYNNLEVYDKAKEYSTVSLSMTKELFGPLSLRVVDPYLSSSNAHSIVGENVEASKLLDSAIYISKYNNSSRILSSLYYAKAQLIDDLNLRKVEIKKAIEICPEDTKCYQNNLARYYNGLGVVYSKQGNKIAAKNYFNQAKEVCEEKPSKVLNVLTDVYFNLSQLEHVDDNHEIAIDYLKKAIGIHKNVNPNSTRVAMYNSMLAGYFLEAGNLQASKKVLDHCLSLKNEALIQNHEFLLMNYKNLSNYYLQTGDYSRSFDYINLAMEVCKSHFAKGHRETNEIELLSAKINHKNGKGEASLLNLNSLKEHCGFNFENAQIDESIPQYQYWYNFNVLSDYLQIEEQIHQWNKDDVIQRIRFGIDLIDKLRTQFFFESSELEFRKAVDEFYSWSLNKLFELPIKDERTYTMIFEIIEKSKTISLNRNLERTVAVNSKYISNDLLDREKSLIYDYEKAYQEFDQINFDQNDSIRSSHVQNLVALQESKDGFLDSLKANHPKYFKGRYEQEVIDLNHLRSVANLKELTFLIYYWGDDFVYQYAILPDTIDVKRFESLNLQKSVEEVNRHLSDKSLLDNESSFYQSKSDFIKNSRSLHRLFVGESLHPSFNVIVIPEGPLCYFPFDLLLEEDVSDGVEYRTLPYFLKNHCTTYAGSASNFLSLIEQQSTKFNIKYAGFAPSYNDDGMLGSVSSLSDGNRGVRLGELKYNDVEVTASAALFDGQVYTAEAASESQFKSTIDKSNVLHLAMHTLINDELPMDSYLSFSKDSSMHEDGNLHVSEISKMKLENKMLVLSSCQTNSGKMEKGIGFLGIAKAFQMANCSNLVLSNWLVDDKSASQLIYGYFEKLKSGLNPVNALRSSKLAYLDSSNTINSHPYYWAAFSYYGHMEIQKESSNRKFLLGALMGMFCISMLMYYRLR